MEHGHGGHGGGGHDDTNGSSSGMSVADTSYILLGIPILLYGYFICLDAYNAFGRRKSRITKAVEPWFLVLFGLLLFFASLGRLWSNCSDMACKNEGALTLILGLFMMALGSISFLNSCIPLYKYTASWTMSVTLVLTGIVIFYQQPENGHYGYFMSLCFVVSCFASALLRALMLLDPERWAIFASYALSIAGFALMGLSKTMEQSVGLHFMVHNVILGICVLSALLLIPLMAAIAFLANNSPTKEHIKQKANMAKGND